CGRLALRATLVLHVAFADPVRQTQSGDDARVDAATCLDALLSLEGHQRLPCPRAQHSICCTGEQAAFDQNLLHLPDLVRRQIECRDATAASAATREVSPRSDRDSVDHPAGPVHKDDFIVHDEETVVAYAGKTSISVGKAATDATPKPEGTTTPGLTLKLTLL